MHGVEPQYAQGAAESHAHSEPQVKKEQAGRDHYAQDQPVSALYPPYDRCLGQSNPQAIRGTSLVSEVSDVYHPEASVSSQDAHPQTDPEEDPCAQIFIQKMSPQDANYKGDRHGDPRGADQAQLHPPPAILGSLDFQRLPSISFPSHSF
jgi:hypothetical protein